VNLLYHTLVKEMNFRMSKKLFVVGIALSIVLASVGVATVSAEGTTGAQGNTASGAPVFQNPFSYSVPRIVPGQSSASGTINTNGNTDNLQEFRTVKMQELETTRRQIQGEILQKTKLIKDQRIACQQKSANYLKQRGQDWKTLYQNQYATPSATLVTGAASGGAPTTGTPFTGAPPTDSLTPNNPASIRAQREALTQQRKQFNTETQQGVKNIKADCFVQERQVLGLSTEVAY
jgi:hypothetical protein